MSPWCEKLSSSTSDELALTIVDWWKNMESLENPVSRFRHIANETPGSTAFANVDTKFNFAELADITQRAATWLKLKSVGASSRVAILVPEEVRAILTISLMQIGAVSSPWVDQAAFQRDEFDLVISNRELSTIESDRQLLITDGWASELLALEPTVEVFQPMEPQQILRVIYSSGTTGLSKGVIFGVSTLNYRLEAARRNWIPAQPFMSLLGSGTVSGFQTFLSQLMHGNSYIVPGSAAKNAFEIASNGVKAIKASPSQLRALLDHCIVHQIQLPSLEVVQSAGSFLPEKLARELIEYFEVDLVNLYGSTETGTIAKRHGVGIGPIDAGTPVLEAVLEVVDESGNAIPTGEEGFIRMKTPGISQGYLLDEDLGKSGFHDGWFYPGDIGSLETDGTLCITGRDKEMVNVGGVKLNLNFIEQEIALIVGALDACVVDFQNEKGDEFLGIAVQLGESVPDSHLRGDLAKVLPAGTDFQILQVAEVPRTLSGKPLRIQVRQLFQPSNTGGSNT